MLFSQLANLVETLASDGEPEIWSKVCLFAHRIPSLLYIHVVKKPRHWVWGC